METRTTTFDIKQGMTVYSADGEKIGKVVAREAEAFLVEKGVFFRKDYLLPYNRVQTASGDRVTLSLSMSQLRELPPEYWTEAKVSTAEPSPPPVGVEEETRVSLAEEQLVAEKTARQTGEVQIKKEVTTETKHIEVPVKKARVEVTRTSVSRPAAPEEATFKESTVTIPVEEEEVEIRKRPVIREEVRVTKTSYEEQQGLSAEARKEEARIEKKGEFEKPGSRSK